MMDERAYQAAQRAAEAMKETSDGDGRFYFSLVKSAFRIIGSMLFIILGFATNEMLLCYGAALFFAAEVLNIAEELT